METVRIKLMVNPVRGKERHVIQIATLYHGAVSIDEPLVPHARR